jgi:hypothetical protein
MIIVPSSSGWSSHSSWTVWQWRWRNYNTSKNENHSPKNTVSHPRRIQPPATPLTTSNLSCIVQLLRSFLHLILSSVEVHSRFSHGDGNIISFSNDVSWSEFQTMDKGHKHGNPKHRIQSLETTDKMCITGRKTGWYCRFRARDMIITGGEMNVCFTCMWPC